MINDLKKISDELILAQDDLDQIDRDYVNTRSRLVLEVLKQFTNESAREAAVTLALEESHPDLLNKLYNLRGLVRKLKIHRENLLVQLRRPE